MKQVVLIILILLLIIGVCVYNNYAENQAIEQAMERAEESQARVDFFESLID